MTRRIPSGRPFVKGVDARRNTRSSGRPPDEWKRQLAALVTRDATLAHVRAVLDAGPDHPQFFRALSYATEHGIGRPTQPVDLTPSGTIIQVISHVPPPNEPWDTPAPVLIPGAR